MLRILTTLLLVHFLPAYSWAQGSAADYERSARWWETVNNKVFPREVRPNWISTNEQEPTTKFWYRSQIAPNQAEILVVDMTTGDVSSPWDKAKLAAALTEKMGQPIAETDLSVDQIRYDAATNSWQFNFRNKGFRWNANEQTLSDADRIENNDNNNAQRRRGGRRGRPRSGSAPANRSPDGKWEIQVENYNLILVNTADQSRHPLTTDGNDKHFYEGTIFWAPNSQRFVGIKTEADEPHIIHIVESSPKDQVQPKLKSFNYHKPGDKLAVRKPCLFQVDTKQPTPLNDSLFPNPWSVDEFRWDNDSSRFTFLYNQRGHQVVRVIAVNGQTGEAGTLIDEASQTFVDYAHKVYSQYLEETDEIIWMSERSGWNHLYLIHAVTGQVLHPITQGEWVVRSVDFVDVDKRQIWFQASGVYPEQDPYYLHYCRVDFDGQNFIVLTAGNGTHEAEFSPDRQFLVDTYSRVDMAPITELRSAVDGKLITTLQTAALQPLVETGWQIPERFSAKGRDGQTDIYGVIYRPSNFDPNRTYPILESIYAGPHGSHVPKSFSSFRREQEIAELGFIIVQIDGMGTSNRSKAFHDVCWKNLGDSGFPDRILWIQAAAKKYPYMDLNRVGLYGGSAGGQSTVRGLLAHGDFYKVGVADCGCHDNRMDKVWWNELWMSYPIDKHYEEQSNVTQAHRLTGKLMLVVGELDDNVDPASTMQVVNALVKADKDFELLILPGVGHGAAETPYGHRRRKDFLVRHLLGVEPRHP
jgi:dipeptidyl aminopeptidase/acylaminoacyl peptidase